MMDFETVHKYKTVILPNIERGLSDKSKSEKELRELYQLYLESLRVLAPYDFGIFNQYLEIDELKNAPNKGFYFHRKKHMGELFNAMNDMEIYDQYDMLLVSQPPRVGKEQPISERVLTDNGWTTMGELQVGDKVIGYDGKETTVTGIFPQGEKEVYELRFRDNTYVRTGYEHLWELVDGSVVTTKDLMLNCGLNPKKRRMKNPPKAKYVWGDKNTITPTPKIQFSKKTTDDDLHPYLIPFFMYFGEIRENILFLGLFGRDKKMIDYIKSHLDTDYEIEELYGDTGYLLKQKFERLDEFGNVIPNKYVKKLKEYGLDENFRTLPTKYLYSDLEDRLEMIHAVFDIFCKTAREKGSYKIRVVNNPEFLDYIQELFLGYNLRTFKNDRVVKNRKEQTLYVFPKENYFIYNPLKHSYFVGMKESRLDICNKVTSYRYVGMEECVCIMVDSPRHLYVTEGYKLTHNTTTGIRFLSWIIGKYPEFTQLATSYSDSITSSFYIGCLEVLQSSRYKEIFPECPIVNQNAKREEIWLQTMKRYPSIAFIPINASMTGRGEANNYLYLDDLVSGIEEAMSRTRLDKLWELYTVNASQRKKDGCKEIHVATMWSVNDPITRVGELNKDNPRCKIIRTPCYNELGESAFNYHGGFTTPYYKELEKRMDTCSFEALYKCNPIEREGLLYHEDDLQYYFELPEEPADTIIAICDSKNLGTDYVTALVGYVYGDFCYIEDVVFSNALPDVTRPLVANSWLKHKVVRGDVEMNNGGNYYAENLDELIRGGGGKTSIRIFFSGNNKNVKIVTYSDYAKTQLVFKHKSKYSSQSMYGEFMRALFAWTQSGKNAHDDAPDATAMMSQLLQDLSGNSIKVLDRKKLKL